jgi:hypothetical protein
MRLSVFHLCNVVVPFASRYGFVSALGKPVNAGSSVRSQLSTAGTISAKLLLGSCQRHEFVQSPVAHRLASMIVDVKGHLIHLFYGTGAWMEVSGRFKTTETLRRISSSAVRRPIAPDPTTKTLDAMVM